MNVRTTVIMATMMIVKEGSDPSAAPRSPFK